MISAPGAAPANAARDPKATAQLLDLFRCYRESELQ